MKKNYKTPVAAFLTSLLLTCAFTGSAQQTKEAGNYLNSLLKHREGEQYTFVKEEADAHNGLHQRYQQYYKGYPVEHGIYMAHYKNGALASVNGEYMDLPGKVSLAKSLSEAQAFESAKRFLAQSETFSGESAVLALVKSELLITAHEQKAGSAQYVLAYSMVIPPYYVVVDAGSGEVLRFSSTLSNSNATGTVTTRYSGTQTVSNELNPSTSQYRLRDYTRTSGSIYVKNGVNGYPPNMNWGSDFVDPNNDNNWSEFYLDANKNDAALDVLWGLQRAYDYYLAVHQRKSYDNVGNGASINAFVHYGSNYDNAAWDFVSQLLFFGDGDAVQTLPVTSLDIVGHELTHGVTANICSLGGLSETGALSEGFSDVFGACIENYVNGLGVLPSAKNPWLDGSEIKPAGYRNIASPKTNSQPDTYLGSNWQTVQGSDFIHRNSTILSHWFYLLVSGSNIGGDDLINDNSETYSVSPLGFSTAEQIAYQMLFYLKGNSGYFDARMASVEAASSLYGAASNQVAQVLKAWHAVGVGSPHCYATGTVTLASAKYISNVTINSGANTSTYNACGYSAKSGTSGAIGMGITATQTISLTSEAAQQRYWAVFIDLNNNRSFGDAGETMYSGLATNPTVTFSIPSGAGTAGGYTYMRVMMSSSPITNCTRLSDGEVEDYRTELLPPPCQTPSVLTSTSVTPSGAVLQWNGVPFAVSYTVSVYVTGQGSPMYTTSVAAPTTTAPVTGLSANTNYQFFVDATCQYGGVSTGGYNGGFSTPACSAPTGLGATKTPTSALLQWSASTYAGSYTVEIFSGGSWSLAGTVNAPATSFSINGLNDGTAYQFRVRSNCNYGVVSALSSAFSFTTPSWCDTDIYEPNETQGTAESLPSSVFTSTSVGGVSSKAANINALICQDNAQSGGSSGDVDWYSFSNQSSIFYQNPLSGYPDVKIDLSNLAGDYDVKLYNASTVQIGSSTNGSTTAESITYHPCNGATGIYYVKVYGYNNAYHLTQKYKLTVALRGVSYSCRLGNTSVDSTQVTGLEEGISEYDLAIFPNPGTGKYTLTHQEPMTGLLIMDAAGKLLDKKQLDNVMQYELDITGYAHGMYFITVNGAFGTVNRKVIKN